MAATKTLSDIINRNDRFDINKISFYQLTGDGSLVIQASTLFDTYYRYVVPYIGTYSVTTAQKRYYKTKPHLLSADIYGTPDLAWLIMKLNDKDCPSRFYLLDHVRLIPMNQLEDVYEIIVTKASKRLNANWSKYLNMVGKDVEESK